MSTTTSSLAHAITTASSLVSAAAASAASASSSSAEATGSSSPSSYKAIGVGCAVASGFFIGSSFVIKKVGLIRSTKKHGNTAGEGHGYLKSILWWTGMIIMILGEILNFVAFAFVEAIVVTPLGALSVVICAILSSWFLKEKLTFFGWIGCALSILGSAVLALNAPEQQSVTEITEFETFFLAPGFLVWTGLSFITSLVLAFVLAPKYGKTSMFVYIGICSLIGGISVSCLQGLGAAILTSIKGNSQIKHWFFWFLLVFVAVTLVIEINYLNKALELFNTSMVTPTYFVMFTTATLISSLILYQGLKTSAISLITMILGFLVTCLGITLLQMSKVDPVKFNKLDRRSTMLMAASREMTDDAEKGAQGGNDFMANEEPSMDALRGGFGTVGSIIRVRSQRRLSNASSFSRAASVGGRPPGMPRFEHPMTDVARADMERYSLSDNPMPLPDDAQDKISAHSPGGVSPGGVVTPRRDGSTGPSHLKFNDQDRIHQWAKDSHDHTAIHTSRPHAGSITLNVPSPTTSQRYQSPAGVGGQQYTPSNRGRNDSVSTVHPISDSPEDVTPMHQAEKARPFFSFRGRSHDRSGDRSPGDRTPIAGLPSQHVDGFYDHHPPPAPNSILNDGSRSAGAVMMSSSPAGSVTRGQSQFHHHENQDFSSSGGNGSGSKHGISSLIPFGNSGSGPDLRLGFKRSGSGEGQQQTSSHSNYSDSHVRSGSQQEDSMKRGGPHRGMKDYPHLNKTKGVKNDNNKMEEEERKALFRSGGGGDDDDDEGNRSGSPNSGNSSMDIVDEKEVQMTRRLPTLPQAQANRAQAQGRDNSRGQQGQGYPPRF